MALDKNLRMSRLLLITGLVGLSGIVFGYIRKILLMEFSMIMEDGTISGGQIMAVFLHANVFILIVSVLLYIYYELHTFANLQEEMDVYKKKADVLYLHILKYLYLMFLVIAVGVLVYSYIYTEASERKNVIYIFVIISIVVIFIMLIQVYGNYKKMREQQDNIGKFRIMLLAIHQLILCSCKVINAVFKKMFKGLSLKAMIISVIVMGILAFASIQHAIYSNIGGEFTMKINENATMMTINYANMVPDFQPEEFKVQYFNNERETGEYSLRIDDFEKSGTEVRYINKDLDVGEEGLNERRTKVRDISKEHYSATYHLDLEQQLKNHPDGQILISFEIHKAGSMEQFEVYNSYKTIKGHIQFEKTEIEVDL